MYVSKYECGKDWIVIILPRALDNRINVVIGAAVIVVFVVAAAAAAVQMSTIYLSIYPNIH